MTVITRDYIRLQKLRCNSFCYLHTHKQKPTPKATPSLSFLLLVSFKLMYYKAGRVKGTAFWGEGGRQEREDLKPTCMQIFWESVLIALKRSKGSDTRPAWVCGKNRSRFLCEPAFSSLSNNSVNVSGFRIFLHMAVINQFLITASKRPDPKLRFRAELLKVVQEVWGG